LVRKTRSICDHCHISSPVILERVNLVDEILPGLPSQNRHVVFPLNRSVTKKAKLGFLFGRLSIRHPSDWQGGRAKQKDCVSKHRMSRKVPNETKLTSPPSQPIAKIDARTVGSGRTRG